MWPISRSKALSTALRARPAVLALLLASACATTAPQPPPMLPMQGAREGQEPVTPQELVALTEGLADTYVGTIADAINTIQAAQPPAEIRSSAQRVKLFVGTTAYSIATSPNPQIGLIDLTVNISVQRSVWGTGLAQQQFGDRSAPLIEAYRSVEEQAWATLGRVFSPSQLDLLRDGISRWVADHPNIRAMPLVHLPALARYRDVTPIASPGGLRMLAPVAEAARAAMELRLLGERSLYMAQRFPYLVNWQSELFLYNTFDTAEVRGILENGRTFASSADRMAGFLGQLPDAALLHETVAELNGTMRESVPMLASMRGVISELNQTFDDANRMLAPFQTPAVGGGPPERKFDVNQYTTAIRELGASVRELNTLLINARSLVTTPELGDRMGQLQSVTESGVGRVGSQGDRWIDRVFWRCVILVAVFFSALLVYRAVSVWMLRRFPPRTGR